MRMLLLVLRLALLPVSTAQAPGFVHVHYIIGG
jgi:hypothetical protein